MPTPKTIRYERFWMGLVESAKEAVAKELENTKISDAAYVGDVKGWTTRTVSELTLWKNLPGTRAGGDDVPKMIARLRRLPAEMKALSGSKAEQAKLVREMTSVSLLRILPFRRTMLWDYYFNSLLPREFIKERVEKKEASLTSGESAFATFAGSCVNYQWGLVIGDSRENLRGTYFVIDRVTGVRSSANVPMRKQTRGKEMGAILAMIVVSLPFANAFRPTFAEDLCKVLRQYEDQIELIWEYEQLAETCQSEEPSYTSDSVESIIYDLTPDADSGTGEARLPGCAIVSGEASGGGQLAASVELDLEKAWITVSPRHHALFVQSELELGAYGVRDRSASLEEFTELGRAGRYRLMAKANANEVPAGPLPRTLALFEWVAGKVDESFVSGGVASQRHRRLETQRELFGALLEYLSTGTELRRETLMRDLHYIGARVKHAVDTQRLEIDILDCYEWAREHRKHICYLTLCVESPVLALRHGLNDESYLSGFEITRSGDGATFRFSQELPSNGHHHPRDAAHEVSGPRRFISLCRSLTTLVVTTTSPDSREEFRVQNFALYRSGSSGPAVCYLPSTLLPHGAIMRIERSGGRVDIDIRSCSGECHVMTTWELRPTLLPLALTAFPPVSLPSTRANFGRDELPNVTRLRLKSLPGSRSLFIDLRRIHVGARARRWQVPSSLPTRLKTIADLVVALARVAPGWVSSMDCLAVIPLPFKDTLELPTLSEWSQGSGRRHLLVAGVLRRSSEMDVWSTSDFDFASDGVQEDPFIERLQHLLVMIQRRQSAMRRIKTFRQSQLVFSHLSHDVCSRQNIQTLRQVLAVHKRGARRGERDLNLLADAEIIVSDLEQLRLLSSEINETLQSPSLDEIMSRAWEAAERAATHAALKIARQGDREVSAAKLKRMLTINLAEAAEGLGSVLISVLLDNLLRNALAGAWEYAKRTGSARVLMQVRHLDHCLAVTNDALPGRWREVRELYRSADRLRIGIPLVRLIADHLNIRLCVQVISDTRGEIQLITERRHDAVPTRR